MNWNSITALLAWLLTWISLMFVNNSKFQWTWILIEIILCFCPVDKIKQLLWLLQVFLIFYFFVFVVWLVRRCGIRTALEWEEMRRKRKNVKFSECVCVFFFKALNFLISHELKIKDWNKSSVLLYSYYISSHKFLIFVNSA